MATVPQIMDALASQIETELCGTADPVIERLQVDGRMVVNPTPPCIDIYPGDPFQEASGYGKGNNTLAFTVRARVSTADNEAGQDLLLAMMDPQADESVEQAIESDDTLGGVVGNLWVAEGPSSYGLFPDPGASGLSPGLLGCVWRVQVTP